MPPSPDHGPHGPIHLPAHAKLNLALSVGAPEGPKGYHPIASWLVAIDLKDDVELRPLPEGTPSRHEVSWAPGAPRPGAIDWPIEKDLGVRAHRLLERRAGRELPLAMSVRKRIPAGGGLGGGSADAAAVLLGVNMLFELGLSMEELAGLSAELGSDVAFFVDEMPPRPALVTGLGETVDRLPPIPGGGAALLIVPPFGCPTGPVYGAFDRGLASRSGSAKANAHRVRGLIAVAALGGGIDGRELFNDLEGPACEVEPRLGEALRELRAAMGESAPVLLTGSGSTMFIPAAPEALPGLAARARAARPDCAAVACRLV